MPEYVQGVELTQDGMHAIFQRMGYGTITSGSIYNGKPTIRVDKLNEQGVMPVLTGVGPQQTSGHWIMLIKGKEPNQFFLFDPLGQSSGTGYQSILATQLPQGATLSVIPNEPGLNMGLCGYWVASAGLRARQALMGAEPPTPELLGQTISEEMRGELANHGYPKITGWLRAVADKFPDGEVKTDATALRHATEAALNIESPAPVITKKKESSPLPQFTFKPAITPEAIRPWSGFSLYTDETVRKAAQYAFDDYLGKPYTGTVEAAPTPMGRQGQMVYRPVHGLGHTLRTMAYAEVIVEEARKAKLRGEPLKTFKDGRTIADVTPGELKKIMIAQAFFVVGRDDEESALNYARYHEQSKAAFLKYVQENESTLIPHVFKDQDDVNFYAAVVEDKGHQWENSPAHVLVNQGHMVDLVRVKQPPESYLESYFKALQPWIGTQGAEAVFATQRHFFNATYETVTAFDSDNPEPHLVISDQLRYVIGNDGQPIREAPKDEEKQGKIKFFPPSYKLQEKEQFAFTKGGLGRYVIGEDGNPIRNPPQKGETVGSLAFFPNTYTLQGNERYMRVDEYLKLDEVQNKFPGAGKKLLRGLLDKYKTDYEYLANHVYSDGRARCENDVDFCLGQLQKAHEQARLAPLKQILQDSASQDRRKANADEVAAARIIQQIMANPEVIHDDHVLLDGQKLEEQFFRALLSKCDMAVVGSLLSDADINNIDKLMEHERNTTFHSTAENSVPIKIGEKWHNELRNKQSYDKAQIKHDLIFLMQNDSWYFSRVNAIAQNRDQGSSFKEVLITTLMTPLTSKSLVDTHGKATSPTTLYRGLSFAEDVKEKLMNQANAIIANTSEHLFTDPAAQTFMQIKFNDLSTISAKTNASNSTNIDVPKMFGANMIFEIRDPNHVLQAKQVGSHGNDSENEFSFYLPEDVVLVPVKVTADGQVTVEKNGKFVNQDVHVITLVAMKSPDFLPRQEGGFATEPYLKMQNTKINEVINAVVAEAHNDVALKAEALYVKLENQSKLPTRGFFSKLGHYLKGSDDRQISQARKDFLVKEVMPVLQECRQALKTDDVKRLQAALNKVPGSQAWAAFQSALAVSTQQEMESLKIQIEKKIALQTKVLPVLEQCKINLEQQQVPEALKALASAQSEINTIKGINDGTIVRITQELGTNLQSLQKAVSTSLIGDADKVNARYDTLIQYMTKKIAAVETVVPANAAQLKSTLSNLDAMHDEFKLIRDEKTRMHTGSAVLDFSDVEALETRLKNAQPKFIPAVMEAITKQVESLAAIPKQMSFSLMKTKAAEVDTSLGLIAVLRAEQLKKDPASDVSVLDGLKARVDTTSKELVDTLFKWTADLRDGAHKQREQDINNYLELSAQFDKTLDPAWVLNKKIELLLETKPKQRNINEVQFKISMIKHCLDAIELEREARIKAHGAQAEVDLDALKGRVQTVNQELVTLMFNATRSKRDGKDKTREQDMATFLELAENLTNTTDKVWVIGKQIEVLLEIKPGQRNIAEVTAKLATIHDCLAAIESEREARIKAHGAQEGQPDVSDLEALKGRVQAVNQELVQFLVNETKQLLENMLTSGGIEKNAPTVKANLHVLTALEKTLDDSEQATQQKEIIHQCEMALINRQEKVFPKLSELQFKFEALIMQLRTLCDLHYESVKQVNLQQLSELGKRSRIGDMFYGRDTAGEINTIKMQNQLLLAFKNNLNDENKSLPQLINLLSEQKNSLELAQKLGISQGNASELLQLVHQLKNKTDAPQVLDECTKLIDTLSVQLAAKPSPLAPMDVHVIEMEHGGQRFNM